MGLSLEQLTGLLGGGTPDLGALMGAAGHGDPALGAVLNVLAQQRAAAAERAGDGATGDDGGDDESSARLVALQARFEHLRDVARRMDAELRALRRRNAHLAAALGACPHCWGENPECGTCAGEGVPGSAPPHRGHWQHYVGALAAPSPRAARPPNSFPRAIAGIPGASQD